MAIPQTFAPVLRLAANTAGRDFVVGDIHGMFSLVFQALELANFDPACDRLISVGDLIDRGPESERCLEFLELPFVHAIRGNHEDLLLEANPEGRMDGALMARNVYRAGQGWWLSVAENVRFDILDALSRLPFAIEIPTPEGLVGVVHADVPEGMGWPEFLALLETQDARTIETGMWGRSRLKRFDLSGVPGVWRVFVGHTVQWQGVQALGNVIAIDTGAVFTHAEEGEEPGYLTIADISLPLAHFARRPAGESPARGSINLKMEDLC